ncbi:hypothetical protein ASD44_09620 [Mesorhizobium sp. Root554]|uniref:DUF1799 domain-containing protein n=1 Tax=unclassified Mesorhizobium TaxID=325217 RepID=UPI0006F9E8BF|nr:MULTISPECIES: DUF1799 domain-containing protein [unclassified Mesorhizobium]KQZ14301.1 hypothetical protein ASD27_09630 [Mesorhizobium sp. Root1471]KQZ36812.1 hypothetical protein ASD44_09620 [Mesorhizobium sp. Root554]
MTDARLWGLPEAEIAALAQLLRGGRASGFAGVWPQNATSVNAFLIVASQWRTGVTEADGRLAMLWIGLDYAGVKVALDARGISLTPALMAGIQVMEMAARDAMNGADA